MKLGTWGMALAAWAAGGLAGCESARYGAIADGTLVLNKGVPLRTEHNMVVHIRGKGPQHEHAYTVLFGPYPPGAGAFGEGKFVTSVPTWVSSGGYTYAIGWWPPIQTPRLRAVSAGTTLIAQTDAGFDRIFLLKPSRGTKVVVETISGAPQSAELTVESYVEATGPIGGAITLAGPTPIPASGPVRDFVDYVLNAAAAADLVK